jgi:glucosylceramidase
VPFGNNLPGDVSYIVNINRNTEFQEIIGFGGSWSDAAAIGLGRMSNSLRTEILRAYFSEEGIEYSTARVVISGSDFSNRPYSYDDTVDDWGLNNWKLADEDVMYKIPQIQEAQRHSSRPIKFMGSSWSPPAWMKTNGELNHGGSLKENAGSEVWKSYARYLLRFFTTYRDNGIDFWGMTVQNEPMTGWDPWFPWNTCGFNAEMERDFAKMDLGPILADGGFPPESFNIMVLDHNRPLAEDWANVVFSDAEASRYVKGLAVHWYFYGTAGPYDVYDRIHEKFPDKFIYATEACNRNDADEADRIALGMWVLAEDYAHDILLDLLHWVTGWTDWNLVLDQYGGPNWVGNNHSAPIIVNPEAGEFYKNVQYYAMAHFSKFLPPGTKRVATTPKVEVEGELELGAFVRPDGGTVVIVINTQDREHIFSIEDPQLNQNVKIAAAPHSFNSYVYYN